MLRHLLPAGLVLALAGLCAGATGCTSLLGDFEVSSSSTTDLQDSGTTGADATTGDGGSQVTQCGGETVDLQTSAKHCGKCDNPCKATESCQAGTCTSSYPAPEFASTPRTPTGWVDAAGAPIAFTMKPTNLPGTTYECRSGPEGKLPPNWAPCDGKQGAEPKHNPQSDQTVPEGTYRMEYRYRVGDYTSPVIGYRFYTLFKLDKTATCPRPGNPDDGPRYGEAEYFAAADAWSKANAGQFPLAGQFPAPTGDRKTSPIWLENPFIKIPFADIEASTGTRTPRLGQPTYNWPAKGGSYVLAERSVRRQFVMDPQRRMILVKRQYVKPAGARVGAGACGNEFEMGSKLAKKRGPIPRGPRLVDCEAWVFNTKGQALCLGRRAGTTVPVALPIDRRPPRGPMGPSDPSLPAAPQGPAAGFTNGDAAPSFVVPGNNIDLLPLFDNLASPQDGYVWIDSPNVGSQRWWKVTGVSKNAFTVAPNTTAPAGKQFIYGCASATNTPVCKWWFTKSLNNLFVVPTGFVKLHERQDHAYALGLRNAPNTGATGTPSPFTKCERAGCNGGNRSYLTFLPP